MTLLFFITAGASCYIVAQSHGMCGCDYVIFIMLINIIYFNYLMFSETYFVKYGYVTMQNSLVFCVVYKHYFCFNIIFKNLLIYFKIYFVLLGIKVTWMIQSKNKLNCIYFIIYHMSIKYADIKIRLRFYKNFKILKIFLFCKIEISVENNFFIDFL